MNANATVSKAHESSDPEIRRFQRNLATFRKLAGWTAEELGQKVGLTKQSIHNLECIPCKVRLSPGYYVAIRSAFENEADSRAKKDDIVLRQALNILLNQKETDTASGWTEDSWKEMWFDFDKRWTYLLDNNDAMYTWLFWECAEQEPDIDSIIAACPVKLLESDSTKELYTKIETHLSALVHNT